MFVALLLVHPYHRVTVKYYDTAINCIYDMFNFIKCTLYFQGKIPKTLTLLKNILGT